MRDAVTSFVQCSGVAALLLLFVTLSVSPLGRALVVRGRATPAHVARARRRFGITTALLALAHALVASALWLRAPIALVLEWPFLRAGLAALVVLALLLATSFPRVVQALRLRSWKELHRLAYVAVPLALQHLALSPSGSRVLLLWLLGASACLVLLRLGLSLRRSAAPDAS